MKCQTLAWLHAADLLVTLISQWPSCPDYAQPQPNVLPARTSRPKPVRPRFLPSLLELMGIPRGLIFMLPDSMRQSQQTFIDAFPDEEEKSGKLPVCPFAWAKEMHQ